MKDFDIQMSGHEKRYRSEEIAPIEQFYSNNTVHSLHTRHTCEWIKLGLNRNLFVPKLNGNIIAGNQLLNVMFGASNSKSPQLFQAGSSQHRPCDLHTIYMPWKECSTIVYSFDHDPFVNFSWNTSQCCGYQGHVQLFEKYSTWIGTIREPILYQKFMF